MKSYTVTKLTRKQIYDEVWSISVSGMAKKYDISYSLLWKQIKDANIPIPPAGYWTKKEYGKETTIAELTGDPDEIVELYKHVPSLLKEKEIAMTQIKQKDSFIKKTESNLYSESNAKESQGETETQERSVQEIKTDNHTPNWYDEEYADELSFLSPDEKERLFAAASEIVLTDENEKMHSKIIAHRKRIDNWEKVFKKQNPYEQKQSRKTAPYLKYAVADTSLPRVYRIIDTLIKAMRPLGVYLDDNLCFHYKADFIQLSFSEATTEVSHEPTKEERMALLKYEDERKHYSWVSKPQIRKYDHIHNGHISVGVGPKRRFRDSKSMILEDQLGDIIIAIFIAVNDAKLAREEREEAERRRKEEEQRKEELRKKYNEEVKRTLALENQAEDFAMACKIRALIDEVESKDNNDSETEKWILWAKAKADWYDPTVAAKDEFFGKRDHSENPEHKRPKERYYW